MATKLAAARKGNIEGERRIVTILFADIKGSTAMAEKLDPEDWAEIMNRAFEFLIEPIYRYKGIVARLMGDAILAFFGAPIAHEDDPQRGVLAALAILNGMGKYREQVRQARGFDFGVRVGLNSGWSSSAISAVTCTWNIWRLAIPSISLRGCRLPPSRIPF